MHNYWISNNLNNPVSKNYFALLAKQWETNKDYSDMANAEWTKQAQSNTNEWSSSTVDLQADSRASHYSEQSQLLNKMFDQQWKFWQTALGYVKDLTNASVTLRTKPPKKT
jgi:prophage DNA circulation protein